MKLNSLKRKITITMAIIAVSVSFAACGKPKPVELPKDKNQKVEDTAMTKKISKEDIVSGSSVYIKDDTIIAAILIKKDATKEQIQKVAEKYADELKKEYNNLQGQYKGMKINVQAVQNGKNMANILIEK